MASIHKEVLLEASAAKVWAAVRDVGNAHRLFDSVLTDCRLDGDSRVVTFVNGMIAREKIIDIDDARRRVAYAVTGDRFTHHSASMQVFPESGERSRFVWISDFLPNDLSAMVAPLVDQGCAAVKRVLERTPAR